uniref:Cytochrome P450 6k1-like n=1 Tax=Diabrotica virgifera virgifera TaxID=50390 RepID=A0A6P7GR05_DIAVI
LFIETLRKHPPASLTGRVCNTAYKVPGSDLIIEPGVKIRIPIQGIHRDPEYYPEPEKFDPERFSEENKATRPNGTFMPFGEGPRMCIGKHIFYYIDLHISSL